MNGMIDLQPDDIDDGSSYHAPVVFIIESELAKHAVVLEVVEGQHMLDDSMVTSEFLRAGFTFFILLAHFGGV